MKKSGSPVLEEVMTLKSTNSSTAVTGVLHRFVLCKHLVLGGAMFKMRLRVLVTGALAADKITWGAIGGYAASA